MVILKPSPRRFEHHLLWLEDKTFITETTAHEQLWFFIPLKEQHDKSLTSKVWIHPLLYQLSSLEDQYNMLNFHQNP